MSRIERMYTGIIQLFFVPAICVLIFLSAVNTTYIEDISEVSFFLTDSILWNVLGITAFVFLSAAICMTILGNTTLVYVFVFSCILLAMVGFDVLSLPKWLNKIINILDQYSYTLYLMHGVIFCSILDRLNALGVSKIIIVAVAIVGTFLATMIVGKLIEKPIQRFLRNKLIKTEQQ